MINSQKESEDDYDQELDEIVRDIKIVWKIHQNHQGLSGNVKDTKQDNYKYRCKVGSAIGTTQRNRTDFCKKGVWPSQPSTSR